MTDKVVVVGAGMGGLVSALLLAQRGVQVTVVESQSATGGKVHTTQVAGVSVDSGPTVLTMRWVFDEILRQVGTDLDHELHLTPLNVLARHFWPDGQRMDLCADPQQSEAEVERFAGGDEAERFRRFCNRARALYDTLEAPFMKGPAPQMGRFMSSLGFSGLALLSQLGPMRSLWRQLQNEFSNPRLRQLFGRYATYCGSSPWEAPATLMLIAQVEMDGVFSIQGGMSELAQTLTRLAQQRGVRFMLQTPCREILVRQGKAVGVRLDREELMADAVVYNGEVDALRHGLLGEPIQEAVLPNGQPRSLSALTWSVLSPRLGMDLDRHNVFFQNDYQSEFDDIFTRRRLPRTPTVYVCAQDRPGMAGGHSAERLFCLVNAPAHGDEPERIEEIEQCETTSFEQLSRLGLSIQGHTKVRASPAQFHRRFPGSGGSLYGKATHGWMSIFARPGAHTALPGLFLAGGGTHPGPGVPMTALSGMQAAEAVTASLASIKKYHPVATFGGMSTP
jgi:1-hydroxycarotenoid 3,4-desaturase